MSEEYYFCLGQLLQALSIARDEVFTYKIKKGTKEYIEAADYWFKELKDLLNNALEECDKE